MTHACPIPGCTADVKREHLMCYGHWMRVPVILRRIIRDEVRTRSEAYERAVHEAIVAVTEKEANASHS